MASVCLIFWGYVACTSSVTVLLCVCTGSLKIPFFLEKLLCSFQRLCCSAWCGLLCQWNMPEDVETAWMHLTFVAMFSSVSWLSVLIAPLKIKSSQKWEPPSCIIWSPLNYLEKFCQFVTNLFTFRPYKQNCYSL